MELSQNNGVRNLIAPGLSIWSIIMYKMHRTIEHKSNNTTAQFLANRSANTFFCYISKNIDYRTKPQIYFLYNIHYCFEVNTDETIRDELVNGCLVVYFEEILKKVYIQMLEVDELIT